MELSQKLRGALRAKFPDTSMSGDENNAEVPFEDFLEQLFRESETQAKFRDCELLGPGSANQQNAPEAIPENP